MRVVGAALRLFLSFIVLESNDESAGKLLLPYK
jgi:hypothetical protein